MLYDIEKTLRQYNEAIEPAKSIFLEKNKKYGQSWRVLRMYSIIEQGWIKIKRIRTIQEKKGSQQIKDEPIVNDFDHIINYCVIGIIKTLNDADSPVLEEVLEKEYGSVITAATDLMRDKNDDYGEAWRILHISTMIDLMLAKCLRAWQMHRSDELSNKEASEILKDILNYAVFCRIKINEGENPLL